MFRNLSLVGFLLALAAIAAHATPIPIMNTGAGAEGSVDAFWTVNGGDAYTTVSTFFPFPLWFPNTVTSKWISPQPAYTPGITDLPGPYIYSTTFDLTGLIPSTASITFQAAVDDDILGNTSILLNGVSTGLGPISGFGGFSDPFTISSGFMAGINTLEFVTVNAPPGPPENPSGLRVEFIEAEADPISIPEPSIYLLTGLGLVAVILRRQRRSALDRR